MASTTINRSRRRGNEISNNIDIDLDALLPVHPEGGKPKQSPGVPGIEYVAMAQIQQDKGQPRKTFEPEDMKELTDSILQQGLLQPVMVRPIPTWDKSQPQVHTLVIGERRWRAAQAAGLEFIPAVIRDVTPQQALELQLVENVQRAPLISEDFAAGCERLMIEFNQSVRQIAKQLGKSPSTISRVIRVFKDPVLAKAVEQGTMSYSTAAELVAKENRKLMHVVKEAVDKPEAGKRIEIGDVRTQRRSEHVGLTKPDETVATRNTQSPKPKDPYVADSVEPVSIIRQGVIGMNVSADKLEKGKVSPQYAEEVAAVMEEYEKAAQRIWAAIRPKLKKQRSA